MRFIGDAVHRALTSGRLDDTASAIDPAWFVNIQGGDRTCRRPICHGLRRLRSRAPQPRSRRRFSIEPRPHLPRTNPPATFFTILEVLVKLDRQRGKGVGATRAGGFGAVQYRDRRAIHEPSAAGRRGRLSAFLPSVRRRDSCGASGAASKPISPRSMWFSSTAERILKAAHPMRRSFCGWSKPSRPGPAAASWMRPTARSI